MVQMLHPPRGSCCATQGFCYSRRQCMNTRAQNLISGHVPYSLVHLIQTLHRQLVHLRAFRAMLCIIKQVHR